MATSEERMKVLQMIQDGKISAEQGAQLIEAMESGRRGPGTSVVPPVVPAPPIPGGRGARWFRVRVTDTNTGKTRVNVRLPVNLVHAGLKMGAKFSPEVEGLDQEQLLAFINSGEVGKLLDVYDDEDGEHVEVFLE